jgi:hypothetical protein
VELGRIYYLKTTSKDRMLDQIAEETNNHGLRGHPVVIVKKERNEDGKDVLVFLPATSISRRGQFGYYEVGPAATQSQVQLKFLNIVEDRRPPGVTTPRRRNTGSPLRWPLSTSL